MKALIRIASLPLLVVAVLIVCAGTLGFLFWLIGGAVSWLVAGKWPLSEERVDRYMLAISNPLDYATKMMKDGSR